MMDGPLSRLQSHWVYGGALAGVLLLVLAPLLISGLTPAGSLVYLGLAAYMIHQYEEHDADRFRRFVNRTLLRGHERLTTRTVFVINIFGVWAVLAATFWATEKLGPGWATVSGWFLVVNGLAHLGLALAMRRPNPGLWTGVLIFLPLGLHTLATLRPTVPTLHSLLALLFILGLHAVIVALVARAQR